MLQQERHHQIIAKIHLDGQVKVKDLAKEFDVTEDCIRKDLTALEKEGLIKKIHGGAMQARKNLHFFQVNERMNVYSEEKKKIAQKAMKFIEPGSMIFLGISTVTLEIAKMIYQKSLDVTVVTNMIDIMKIFSDHCPTKLIFIGGSFNRSRDGFIGSIAIEQVKQYRFDVSFIGVVGINAFDDQITTYDVNDGLTKREVIHSSKKSYIVAESAKLNQDGNYVFASLSDFTGYICEGNLETSVYQKLKGYEIEIV